MSDLEAVGEMAININGQGQVLTKVGCALDDQLTSTPTAV
jgi:hypothetical protein